MTDVIRRLVDDHNITNAAIIFDDSYGGLYLHTDNGKKVFPNLREFAPYQAK